MSSCESSRTQADESEKALLSPREPGVRTVAVGNNCWEWLGNWTVKDACSFQDGEVQPERPIDYLIVIMDMLLA